MDLAVSHMAIASASVSEYAVVAVADVGVVVVAVEGNRHYGAYRGSGEQAGFDRVVAAFPHWRRRRQQQLVLGPFYLDPMAYAF